MPLESDKNDVRGLRFPTFKVSTTLLENYANDEIENDLIINGREIN